MGSGGGRVASDAAGTGRASLGGRSLARASDGDDDAAGGGEERRRPELGRLAFLRLLPLARMRKGRARGGFPGGRHMAIPIARRCSREEPPSHAHGQNRKSD